MRALGQRRLCRRLLPDACHAAAFLREFAGEHPWAHLDIAGVETGQGACAGPGGADRLRRAPARPAGGDAVRGRAVTEIGFYHLTRTRLDQALPRLLGRVLSSGGRAFVLCGEAERATVLDAALWTAPEPDWLPHGLAGGADDALQPILIGTMDAPPGNGSAVPVPGRWRRERAAGRVRPRAWTCSTGRMTPRWRPHGGVGARPRRRARAGLLAAGVRRVGEGGPDGAGPAARIAFSVINISRKSDFTERFVRYGLDDF